MEIDRIKLLPSDERETLLEGEALDILEQGYMRKLSEDELAIRKDELAENSILQAIISEELRQVKEQYKGKLEPIREKITELISEIKTKAVEVKGRVYKMADYDNQMIHILDPLGNVISSRKMMPEERQFRISTKSEKSA